MRSFSRVKSTRRVPTRNRYSCVFAVSFFTSPKIDLQRIQSAANIAALFFWQSSQMLSGFFFDLKPVAHCRFPAAKLIPPAGRIQDGCSSVKERFGEAAETRTRGGRGAF